MYSTSIVCANQIPVRDYTSTVAWIAWICVIMSGSPVKMVLTDTAFSNLQADKKR